MPSLRKSILNNRAMRKNPTEDNDGDFLLRFWAFLLTAFYCVIGLTGGLILVGTLGDDSDTSYVIQCAIGGLLFGFACVAIATYWGLLLRQAWAKTLLLVVAWVALIAFPIGTGFGIMVLFELRCGQRRQPIDHADDVEMHQKRHSKVK